MTSHTALKVKLDILTCTRCELSTKCRAPVPFNSTLTEPDYIVVGEAPGRMEDYKNVPFYGPAGQLLRRNLDRVGLPNTDGAYINAACCWPSPSLFDKPNKDHLTACATHLKAQLELFPTPHVLLTGLTALRAILPSADLLRTMCNPFTLYDKTFFTVWHPAYINRNMGQIKVWRSHLALFWQQVQGFDDSYPLCIYCDRSRERGHNTCRKHITRFNKDARWPVYKSQQSLFE